MNEEGRKDEKTLTEQRVGEDNTVWAAKETSSALSDERLDAIVRFLARRAAERDYAVFVKGLLSDDNREEE